MEYINKITITIIYELTFILNYEHNSTIYYKITIRYYLLKKH